eukprot:7753119-Heterocapsa_arctica.AAC.1
MHGAGPENFFRSLPQPVNLATSYIASRARTLKHALTLTLTPICWRHTCGSDTYWIPFNTLSCTIWLTIWLIW